MRFSSLVLLSLFIPIISFSATVKCLITGAKETSTFHDFVGGSVVIDLEQGNTTLFRTVENNIEELAVISGEAVSSFQVSRSACIEGSETIVRHDGSLRAKLFKFNSCVHRDANYTGYVRADVGFDLTSNSGKYREIFLTPRGTPPTAHIDFEDCGIDE